MPLGLLSRVTASELSGISPTTSLAGRIWSVQVEALYALLYPLMIEDFRHMLDCSNCHTSLNLSYVAQDATKHRTLPIPTSSIASSLVVRGIGPFGVHAKNLSKVASKGFVIPGIIGYDAEYQKKLQDLRNMGE